MTRSQDQLPSISPPPLPYGQEVVRPQTQEKEKEKDQQKDKLEASANETETRVNAAALSSRGGSSGKEEKQSEGQEPAPRGPEGTTLAPERGPTDKQSSGGVTQRTPSVEFIVAPLQAQAKMEGESSETPEISEQGGKEAAGYGGAGAADSGGAENPNSNGTGQAKMASAAPVTELSSGREMAGIGAQASRGTPYQFNLAQSAAQPKMEAASPSAFPAPVQAKAGSGGGNTPPTGLEGEGPGRPLPGGVRSNMEQIFEEDFSRVMVHTDSPSAKDMGALAFTVREDIYFAPGKFKPDSEKGLQLIGHELTHVLQQREGLVRPPRGGRPFEMIDDPRLEREADEMGWFVMRQTLFPEPDDVDDEPIEEPSTPDYITEGEDAYDPFEMPAESPTEDEPLEYQEPSSPEEAEGNEGIPAEGEGAGAEAGGGEAESEVKHNPALDQAAGYLREQAAPIVFQDSTEVRSLSQNERKKDDATTKTVKANDAVDQPEPEPDARTENFTVGIMDEVESPATNPEEARGKFDQKLQSILPRNLKDVYKFKKRKKAKVLPAAAESVIKVDVESIDGTYKQIEDTPAPGDLETGNPIGKIEKAPNTAKIDPGLDAIADLRPEHTDFTTYEEQVDQRLEEGGLDEEKLNLVQEGDLYEARLHREEVKTTVAGADSEIRGTREEEKGKMETDLQKEEVKERGDMRKERNKGLKKARGKQDKTKSNIEKERDAVATHIRGLYETAKTTVHEKLDMMNTTSMAEFSQAQEIATREFEDNVDIRIRAFKKRRYRGWRGKLRWLKDLFKGIADLKEVKEILETEKQAFVDKIDKAITTITERNEATIEECRQIIADTRTEIDEYVDGLREDLKWIAESTQREISGLLDSLDDEITMREQQLRDELEMKKEEAIAEIDKKIQEIKEKLGGLLDKIFKLFINIALKFLEYILRAAGLDPAPFIEIVKAVATALMAIVKRPIQFLKDLFASLVQGFKLFTDNLKENLIQSVVSWLTGRLATTGLYIPRSFNGKEILKMAMSIFGIDKEGIKQRIIERMGIVGTIAMAAYDAVKAFQDNGLKGVWDAFRGQVTSWAWSKIRKRLVKKIGEEKVQAMENVMMLILDILTRGPEAALDYFKENLDAIKDLAISTLKDWLIQKLIMKGLQKLMTMFIPIANIVESIILIYNIVMFFLNNGSLLGQLFKALVMGLQDVANGDVDSAARKVVVAMKIGITLALDFLARYLQIDNIIDKIKKVLGKIRDWVDKIVNKALDWIFGGLKKFWDKLKDWFSPGEDVDFDEEEDDGNTPDDGLDAEYGTSKAKKIRKGLERMDAESAERQESGTIDKEDAIDVAVEVINAHPVFSSITVMSGENATRDITPDPNTWIYGWTASPLHYRLAGRKSQEDNENGQFIGQHVDYLGYVRAANGIRFHKTPRPDDPDYLGGQGIYGQIIPYADPVRILGLGNPQHSGWVYFRNFGGDTGWIEGQHLSWLSPDSNLDTFTEEPYFIREGDYLENVIDRKCGYLGQVDRRITAQCIVELNKNSQAIYLQDSSWSWQDLLDPYLEDARAIYQAVGLRSGQILRLPTMAYYRMLEANGTLDDRPEWLDAAIDWGQARTGFMIGVGTGFINAVVDTATGLWGLVKGVFTGEIFSAVADIYRKLEALGLNGILEMVGELASGLVGQVTDAWNNPNVYEKWKFFGKIVGYILFEVLLAWATAGIGTAIKGTSYYARVTAFLGEKLGKVVGAASRLSNEARAAIAALSEATQEIIERLLRWFDNAILERFTQVQLELLDQLSDASLIRVAGHSFDNMVGYMTRIEANIPKANKLLEHFGDFKDPVRFGRVLDVIPDWLTDLSYWNRFSEPMKSRYLELFDDYLDGLISQGQFHARLALLQRVSRFRTIMLEANIPGLNIGSKNIAYGTYDVLLPDGTRLQGNFLSVSGKSSSQKISQKLGSSVDGHSVSRDIHGGKRKFDATAPNNHDSEVKFLEDLAENISNKLDTPIKKGDTLPEITGSIRITSEMSPCGSCRNVIEEQWDEMFANIDLPPVDFGVKYD